MGTYASNQGGDPPGEFMQVNTDANHFILEINLVPFCSGYPEEPSMLKI